MTKNLIYRGPEPSRATRTISRRSRASLRGSLVARLPGFEQPRIIQFESALEYAFLCLTLVRDDVQHIWEQPTAVQYTRPNGRPAEHVFDFLVTKTDGERIAVAIKPMQRVVERTFVAELEGVAAATPKQFADRIMLITDRHLDRAAAAEAARTLAWSRAPLTEVAA
ncbi:restriction endonuclease [Paracoccus sp. p3-h83]|uniref:restriction endonuclease n=1 Tax=Paracoccus sp. p3-h83 TaxID=3342805 RepID=UPI0035BB9902